MQTKIKVWWHFAFIVLFSISAIVYLSSNFREDPAFTQETNKNAQELYNMLEWLGKNTQDSDAILTQWTTAPFVYGIANRKVIATSKVYPSEVEIVAGRYSDLSRFFFSTNEDDSMDIIKKYNVTYVVVPVKFDFNNCWYTSACDALLKENQAMVYRLINKQELQNFQIVYDTDSYKIYKVLPSFINESYGDFYTKQIAQYLTRAKNQDEKSKNVVGSIVPHHIDYASQIILENMALMDKDYERIIILGPDHYLRGGFPIMTSDLNFEGYHETMKPDMELMKKLKIPKDNGLYKFEWSIRTILPFISYWQKDAKIVPIHFQSQVKYEDAVEFGERLAGHIDDKTLLIVSVDFSHIIPANENISYAEDHKTLNSLQNFRKEDIYKEHVDAQPAVVAFIAAMEKKQATNVRLLNISSKTHPKDDSTQSVGYISLHYSK